VITSVITSGGRFWRGMESCARRRVPIAIDRDNSFFAPP
jgi:hypothetical protein